MSLVSWRAQVDVWAAGVVVYQMLFGKRPFGEGCTQEAILREEVILNAHEVAFPAKPAVSADARDFITRCKPTLRGAFVCQYKFVLDRLRRSWSSSRLCPPLLRVLLWCVISQAHRARMTAALKLPAQHKLPLGMSLLGIIGRTHDLQP